MVFKVETEWPIALDSPDHLNPLGTMQDNHGGKLFIDDFINWFKNNRNQGQPINGRELSVADLGCSGGQLIKEWLEITDNAIGLEGSDWSVNHRRANWPSLHNKNLFTCDVSRDYTIKNNGQLYQCDLISAWEVLEHISTDRLPTFFDNIHKHLKSGGVFLGSASNHSDTGRGSLELHQSRFTYDQWVNKYFPQDKFAVVKYPFEKSRAVRQAPMYFFLIKR